MSKDEAIKARLREAAKNLNKLIETWDFTRPSNRIMKLWGLEAEMAEVADIEMWKMKQKTMRR
jgi:hypothetical protein